MNFPQRIDLYIYWKYITKQMRERKKQKTCKIIANACTQNSLHTHACMHTHMYTHLLRDTHMLPTKQKYNCWFGSINIPDQLICLHSKKRLIVSKLWMVQIFGVKDLFPYIYKHCHLLDLFPHVLGFLQIDFSHCQYKELSKVYFRLFTLSV